MYLYLGSCSRDRMVVGFITTCAISAHHYSGANPGFVVRGRE